MALDRCVISYGGISVIRSGTGKTDRRLTIGLGVLQVLIGLSAVGGGVGLVSEPSGANLGFPPELLGGSPFSDYLIPGLVLLVFNGIGSLVGAAASFHRHRHAAEIAAALGAGLVIWIVAQVWWIGLVHWLQPLFFGLGVVELTLGLLLRGARQIVC